MKVYKALVKKGYLYLQLKGNLGVAATVNGKEIVTLPEMEKVEKQLKKDKEEGCTSSKDSGLKGIVFKRDFQLIRLMFMQPSSCSIADAAQLTFFA